MAANVQSGSDVSVTSLVGGIVNDAQELMKQQFALLKAEVREDMRKTTEASTALGVGVAATLLGGIVLCFAAAHLLSWAFPTVPLWVWYAVVGGVVTAVGVGLSCMALQKFRSFNPLPDQTAEALKENLEWKTKPR
jgi:multidrug transporter EmrE-like cation transporter